MFRQSASEFNRTMLIEFQCTNHSGYDAARGRYIVCDHLMVVSDDQIGNMVPCDKCGQLVEVPFDYGASSHSNKNSRKPRRVAGAAPKRPTADPPSQKRERPTKKKEMQRRDVMSIEFETETGPAQRQLHRSDRQRCPKCGALLADSGHCTLCHYVQRKYDADGIPLNQIKVKPAGFQLWISQTVSDGVSVKVLGYFLGAMISLLYLIVASVAVLSGGVAGFLFLFLATLAYIGFVLTIIKTWRLATVPTERLGFLTPFWNMLLLAARSMKWQAYDSRFKGRKIVDMRNAPLTDDQLAEIKDLKQCQVLDLENSMVTDKGLRHLYSLTDLRCLVVRKTRVSHEGVFRLQQAHPRMWIWY